MNYQSEPIAYFPGLEDDYTVNQVRELVRMSKAINACAGQAARLDSESALEALEASNMLLTGAERMLIFLFPDQEAKEAHHRALEARERAAKKGRKEKPGA